jgi:hypothetical protein
MESSRKAVMTGNPAKRLERLGTKIPGLYFLVIE